MDALIGDLLDNSFITNGKRMLARGAVGRLSKKFEITPVHVYRLWKRAKQSRCDNGGYFISSATKKGRSGHEHTYEKDDLEREVEKIAP